MWARTAVRSGGFKGLRGREQSKGRAGCTGNARGRQQDPERKPMDPTAATQIDHGRGPPAQPSAAQPSILGPGSPDAGETTRQNSPLHASISMDVPPRAAFNLQAVLQGLWSRSFPPVRKAIESAAARRRCGNLVNVTLMTHALFDREQTRISSKPTHGRMSS